MKRIGSMLLMCGFVCFLGGIVGCPATPPAKDVVAKDKDAASPDASLKDATTKDAAAKDAAAKDGEKDKSKDKK